MTLVHGVSRVALASAAGLLAVILLLLAAPAVSAPGYDNLTADQLEQYARARSKGYAHDDAVEYAQKPIPKSVDELTPEQRDDYETARDRGGLNDHDAFDYATQPPAPPLKASDANRPLGELDAERAADLAAAEAARQRAAELRGTSTGAAGGDCGYDVPGLLATLDDLSHAGNTQAYQQLWNSLPQDVQRQVSNLQAVRDASETEWFGTLGIDPEDQGFVWAAESAALLNTAAQAGAVPVTFVQRGQEYYGPIIADLEARQQKIGSDLVAAQQNADAMAHAISAARAEEWFGGVSEWWDPNQALADATATVASLTKDYALVTEELENVRRAQASYASVAPLADIRANAQAHAAEEERRFQEVFTASQALSQQNAVIMTGQLAFADARTNLQARIDGAIADGRDSAAEQWQLDLGYLQTVETGWLSMQTHIANGLQRDLDNLLARNSTEDLGPKDGADLVNGMVARGLYVTLDPGVLQQVQARVSAFAAGVQNNRESPLDWKEVVVTFSGSVDEAFVAPWELIYDPVGSLKGNLRFWRRFASYAYGVGNAAVDGVIDIVVLSKESLDTQLELIQWNFNATLGTDIDWVGNENLQFIAGLGDLSSDKAAQILSDITRSINRRIEMNAASGETGIRNMLSDTGYVVGTVAGAEEGLIRAVVITTKYGKVLVKGKAVEEMLDKAADAAKVGDGTVTRLDDAVLTMPDSALDNPFGAGDIPPTNQPGSIPPTVQTGSIPPTNQPGSIPPTNQPGSIPPTIEPGRVAGPVVGPPQLINQPGGSVRMHRTGERNPVTGKLDGKQEAIDLYYGDRKLELRPTQYIGEGSTTRTYTSPNAPNTAIKITSAAGESGLLLDNYGYRVLQDGLQSGAIDPTKVHVPTVHRQIPIQGGGTVSVVELGPETVQQMLSRGRKLNDAEIAAIKNGVEELAKNRIIFADFKLDNFGLKQLDNGEYQLWIHDPGSIILADSADTARRFYSDMLNPPQAALDAVAAISRQEYTDALRNLGRGRSGETVGRANQELLQALDAKRSLVDGYQFSRTPAGNLARDVFNGVRTRAFKTWLDGAYKGRIDLEHFNAGTGLKLDGLGPGPGGLTYNPAAGRQSKELREAFGAAPGPGAIGDSPLPFRLGSDVSGPSDSSMGYLPGWHSPPLGIKAGRAGTDASSFTAYLPYRWSNDPLNNIALKPFIERRIVFGVTRLFGVGCDWPAAITFTAPASQQAALRKQVAALPGVTFVENDAGRTEQILNDPLYEATGPSGQDALRQAGLTDALLAEIAASDDPAGVVVAVVDTGLAWGHRDLDARVLWVNPREIPDNAFDDDANGYVDDVVGWNFIDDNNLPWDTDGHGTMVAGIIAAQSGNGVGIAGINPHAQLMVLRALDGYGRGRASHTAAAIVYAVDNGAQIVNVSLGGRDLTHAETLAIEFANRSGVLVVAAAGNEGIDLEGWGPASARGVLVVGAVGPDGRAAASNWGRRLDLVAPGVDVVSLRAPGTDLMAKFDGSTPLANAVGKDGAYYRASGTSFAAPIVTGVASVIAQRNPGLSAVEIKRMLVQSTEDVGTPGVDLTTGSGRLDAPAALTANPRFFIDASIEGVTVVRTATGQALDVIGAADAERFSGATLAIGAGEAPTNWREVATIAAPSSGVIARVPAASFAGSPRWTLRLVVRHTAGREREARFDLKLQ